MFLEIRGIRKSFGEGDSLVEVLKGIDLSVEKGEFCVLLGPSGSGKSTLLNIIGGIDRADEGSITIAGEKTEDMDEKRLTNYRRKHLGYIFQMYNLIPNLTAEEPMEMLGKYGRMRQRYLEQHKPILFQTMLLNGELTAHLREIDKTANEQLNNLMRALATEAGATEQLKATDQLAWVGLMNNLKAQAEELILTELVYS